MKLITKEIEKKLQKQYPLGTDLQQNVVCKIFDPCSQWTWYVMNQDPDDLNYLWGIVRGLEVEIGSFSLSELSSFKNKFSLPLERDLYFKERPAKDVYNDLLAGKHV